MKGKKSWGDIKESSKENNEKTEGTRNGLKTSPASMTPKESKLPLIGETKRPSDIIQRLSKLEGDMVGGLAQEGLVGKGKQGIGSKGKGFKKKKKGKIQWGQNKASRDRRTHRSKTRPREKTSKEDENGGVRS